MAKNNPSSLFQKLSHCLGAAVFILPLLANAEPPANPPVIPWIRWFDENTGTNIQGRSEHFRSLLSKTYAQTSAAMLSRQSPAAAGTDLATTLWTDGYSDAEIRLAVSRSALLLEAAHLLQNSAESGNSQAAQALVCFLEKSRKHFETTPNVRNEALVSLLGVPAMAGLASVLTSRIEPTVFAENPQLLVGLLAYRTEMPRQFQANLRSLTRQCPSPDILEQLFVMAEQRAQSMKNAANAALENLTHCGSRPMTRNNHDVQNLSAIHAVILEFQQWIDRIQIAPRPHR